MERTSVRPGETGHAGGPRATERLLRLTEAGAGQRIADLGCGTGRTAAMIAGSGMDVTAVDIDAEVLARARVRAAKRGVAGKVYAVQADVHRLPFEEGTFDAALAESVLAFCDADRAAREAFRALKPGGIFGINELTYMREPDPGLKAVLRLTMGLSPRGEAEWKAVLRKAGFVDVASETSKISLPGQLLGCLRADGPLRDSLFSSRAARALLSRKALKTVIRHRSSVGYGLYVGRKPRQ